MTDTRYYGLGNNTTIATDKYRLPLLRRTRETKRRSLELVIGPKCSYDVLVPQKSTKAGRDTFTSGERSMEEVWNKVLVDSV